MNRDKVRGMMLGIAIGDALGMPVEMKTAAHIKEKYGRIEKYEEPVGHKFFDGKPAGDWTDDTVLSLAVANSLIEAKGFDLDSQAKWNAAALDQERGGWGKTTKEALQRIKDGVHWSEAGKNTEPNRGLGNGVAMKVSPLAVYLLAKKVPWSEAIDKIAKLAMMTHYTGIGVSSGLAHTYATAYCLNYAPGEFNFDRFVGVVTGMSKHGRNYAQPGENKDEDISDRLELLFKHREYTPEKINEELKGGCYVYESLPFSYMYFLRDPQGIDCVYDVVSNGGDTDSNGSMVGALLGALHGASVFPQHLIDGLKDRAVIEDTAEGLCDTFGVN